jgi:ubiquinone/menaquinone biosynthesis C-methylase UbiE
VTRQGVGAGILKTIKVLVLLLAAIPVVALALHTLVRIVRGFYKFPIPQALANLIDNPLRRRIQSPADTAIRHGLEQGMRVLEVGPGNGRYTVASARRVGPTGSVVTIDIEPKMIERVSDRAAAEGVNNIEARVADVYDLPFEDEEFDLAYMVAVIGEIPDPVRAMREIRRVLTAEGRLVFSELLMDPDYPRARTLLGWAAEAGFQLRQKLGKAFYYTLILEKDDRDLWIVT